MNRKAGWGLPGILGRGLGAALLIFGLFPIYRALDTSGEAPVRMALVEMAEAALEFAWWGSLLVVLLAIGLAVGLSDSAIRMARALGRVLTRPPLPLFAAGVGLLALTLSFGVWQLLYEGLYTSVDEMASGIQARYMASGRLTGPPLTFPEGWLIPNTLMVEEGWVSQYPPSHLVLMAFFYRSGIPGLCGPVLMGAMAWLVALSFPRLLPRHQASARTAALLTAISPFLLFLAAGGLSHLTAGAAGAALIYSALRAREGHAAWGLAVGSAVGVMVSARPFIGLVLGTAIPIILWGPNLLRHGMRWGVRRTIATVAGGLPFALLLGHYNHTVFGHWGRLGYLAAYGRNHGLGFHLDPWGYMYGLHDAVGFTSIDLLAAGVQFLESPLPLTILVGVYLLLGPRLPGGADALLAWGFLPVIANAFYWFHDPRMLFEAAPAWIFLSVLGVVEIVGWSENKGRWRKRSGETAAWVAVVALLAATIWGAPTRWQSYRWTPETLGRIKVPYVPTSEPSVVFVHTSWNERLSARLQGAGGMRHDSIVSALRRNSICELHSYADAREARVREMRSEISLPPVDLAQEVGVPEGLLRRPVGPGMTIRSRVGEILTPECLRQVGADRFGAVALAPLLWQGDLPGAENGLPMFVRDLGPETNDRIRALFPGRTAFAFTPTEPGGPPRIVPYEVAMEILWGQES